MQRKLSKPFAENGSLLEIPLDIQSSGSVSFKEGFGGLYSKPVMPQSSGEQAGLQFVREQWNWLFNAITNDIILNSDEIQALEDEIGGLITTLNEKTPKLLTENLTWFVGADQQFETLEDAIFEAAKYKSINNYTITITLKSGFKFTKSLHFKGMFLSHVIINSEDDWVLFDGTPTANSEFYIQYDGTPIAISFIQCETPLISFKLKISEVQRTLVIGFAFLNSIVRMKKSGVMNFYYGVTLVNSFGLTEQNYYENCFNSGELMDNNSMLLSWVPTFKNCAGNIFWCADGSQAYLVAATFDGLFENINSVCVAAHIASYCANNTNTFLNMNNTNSFAYSTGTYGGQIVFARIQTAPGLTLYNLDPNTYSQYGKITLY